MVSKVIIVLATVMTYRLQYCVAVQAEEEVDEKQDDLLKEAPLPPEHGANGAADRKAPPPKSNSAAALADLRNKKGAGATASEGELTVKESRATGQWPAVHTFCLSRDPVLVFYAADSGFSVQTVSLPKIVSTPN